MLVSTTAYAPRHDCRCDREDRRTNADSGGSRGDHVGGVPGDVEADAGQGVELSSRGRSGGALQAGPQHHAVQRRCSQRRSRRSGKRLIRSHRSCCPVNASGRAGRYRYPHRPDRQDRRHSSGGVRVEQGERVQAGWLEYGRGRTDEQRRFAMRSRLGRRARGSGCSSCWTSRTATCGGSSPRPARATSRRTPSSGTSSGTGSRPGRRVSRAVCSTAASSATAGGGDSARRGAGGGRSPGLPPRSSPGPGWARRDHPCHA